MQAAPKATCKECENPSAPSEPWRSSLMKQHPLNESIRKHGTFLTKARRNGVLYLATSRRTRVAKVSRSKTPPRVGNERHTKVSDVSPVSPGNDHHTTVHREREKASCWKSRQDPAVYSKHSRVTELWPCASIMHAKLIWLRSATQCRCKGSLGMSITNVRCNSDRERQGQDNRENAVIAIPAPRSWNCQ